LSSNSDSDPNQHILDTLEQCISVIIEKVQALETQQQQQQQQQPEKVVNGSSSSRMSSLDYTRVNEGEGKEKERYVRTLINKST